MPFALWTKHHEAAAHLCWTRPGKCSCSPLPSSRLGQGKATGELGAVQAAKWFLLYKASPVTCLLPYTLPAVTPSLCRSAEVQAQQPLELC